ncbi:MAG TPA: hypothetical protein VFR67_05965 [Pilimelia sp.]|nr:hypothetical protein [Pilimelia sp.]
MPDLLTGSIVEATDTPATVGDREDVAILGFSDTSYVPGATVCGVAFTAPTTGRVLVTINAFLDNSGATGQTYASFRIGTGSTVGSGTEQVAADDSRSILVTGTNQARAGITEMVTGLTPGDTYNAQMMHRRANSNGDITWRSIIVAPAT